MNDIPPPRTYTSFKRCENFADERGEPPAEIAMAWLLSKPGVTAPIVGVSRISHLESAVRSLSLELSAEEVALLEAPYVPHRILGH